MVMMRFHGKDLPLRKVRKGRIRRRITRMRRNLVKKVLIMLTYLLAETYLEQGYERIR